MKAIVVNFFGGPSAGKTTAALMTTGLLKMSGINAEYVHEFAKDLVYENREDTLSIQPYVTAKQYKKIAILKDKVVCLLATDAISKHILEHYKNNPKAFKAFIKTISKALKSEETFWQYIKNNPDIEDDDYSLIIL